MYQAVTRCTISPSQVTEQLKRWCALTTFPCAFEIYNGLMHAMYKVLIDPYDENEAQLNALEDWERDTKGGTNGLDRSAFMDALFELCDHWY